MVEGIRQIEGGGCFGCKVRSRGSVGAVFDVPGLQIGDYWFAK